MFLQEFVGLLMLTRRDECTKESAMLDLATEHILTLNDACGKLPRRRRGSRPHVATLYRWAQRGIKGVKLETIQVGGTLCTSVEALQRFFDRLSEPREPTPRQSPHRQREIEAAERECREAGI